MKMYPFKIVQQDDSSWLFELNGINIIVKDYFIKNNCYHIVTPETAIAFFRFNGDGNIYGLSNTKNTCNTIDAFFDTISAHYSFFDATPITDTLLKNYGFSHAKNEWDLEIKDIKTGTRNLLRYITGKGWYFNTIILKNQPSNLRDLMAEYVKLTGTAMPQLGSRCFR